MGSLKFQFGISKTDGCGGLRKFPYAFTKKSNKQFILEEEQKEAFSKCFDKIRLKCEKIHTVVHNITFCTYRFVPVCRLYLLEIFFYGQSWLVIGPVSDRTTDWLLLPLCQKYDEEVWKRRK